MTNILHCPTLIAWEYIYMCILGISIISIAHKHNTCDVQDRKIAHHNRQAKLSWPLPARMAIQSALQEQSDVVDATYMTQISKCVFNFVAHIVPTNIMLNL